MNLTCRLQLLRTASSSRRPPTPRTSVADTDNNNGKHNDNATTKPLDSYRNHIDKRGLARVLETDQRQLHLLLPEQVLEPFQYRIEETRKERHVCGLVAGVEHQQTTNSNDNDDGTMWRRCDEGAVMRRRASNDK
jgi:hypothetical protein